MRLQEIYFVCRKARESWPEMVFEEIKAPGLNYSKIQNPDAVRSILSDLEKIESFTENIVAIRRISLGFTQSSGEITVDTHNKARLLSEYNRLKNKIITIAELFESINYDQGSEGFDIKLPKEISLSELSKCTHDLEIIFSTCPLFAEQQGTVTFKAVDVGSVWLSFAIGGVAVIGMLKIIAELVDKALIIRSHYLTTREQEETVRGLELSRETLESIVETNKTVQEALKEKVCADLAMQHDIEAPEAIAMLKNSINLLAEWMNRGMEIYASVQASPEVKAVFPAIEKQSLPEGVVGMLTDGSSTKE